MAGNNFNLENTFVQLLRYRCDLIDGLSIKLITSTLIRIISFLAYQFIIALLVIKMTSISNITMAITLNVALISINIGILSMSYSVIRSSEKALLNDIIHNDYYRTHKVNNEIVMDNISSADRLIGTINTLITVDYRMTVIHIIFSFLSILGWIITRNMG